MAEVDSLTIKVVADTGNAVTSIKNVTRAVRELNDSASDRGWRSFTNSITRIGDASKGMGKLVSSLKRIEGMQISPSLKENLDKIADAGARLSGVGKGMYQFGYGLAKLSEAGKDSAQLGENLRRVSSHVIKFSQAISKFVPQDFAQKAASLRQLASTIKNFSKIGEDKDLAKKYNNVAGAVGNFATSLNNAISDEVLARLERIAQALTDISKAAGTAASTVKKAERAGAAASKTPVETAIKWQSVVKAAETANRTLAEIGQGLYGVIDSSGIIADLDSISGAIVKNIPILGELTDAWKHEAAEIKNIVLSQASIVDKAADLMLVKVKHLIKLLYSFAKLPFSAGSMSMTKGIVGMVITPLKDLGKTLTEITKKWNQFVASISRIAIYRLLRTALKKIAAGLKEGVSNLYQWGLAWQGTFSSADKFVQSMDRLATAFLYLRNSVGAAVSPLIDVVAPIIDALIDKFVALTNVINQAIAALSGAGIWRKAIKYPVSYGEAASGASKKVKELERTVLAFDELNKLNDNKDHGGSGASSGLDYSKMFEEMPVNSALADILNSDNWRKLGSMLADYINNALESIDWDSIQSKAKLWAKRFGSFLDQLLLDLNMPLIGKTIGEGLNTIADFINTFFDEFHWVTIGQHLSDGFESLIDTLRWADIGEALSQKWKAIFELVIGFKDVDLTGLGTGIVTMIESAIDNIPVSDFFDAVGTLVTKIGTELGIVLNGLFKKTNELFDYDAESEAYWDKADMYRKMYGDGKRNKRTGGIDFEGLGTDVSTGLTNMFKGIDPAEAGKFLTNGIKAIIEFSTGVLKNDSFWQELNTFVSETITNMFKNIDLKTGIQNAVDLATKIVGLLTTAINSIPWEEVGAAIENTDTSGLVEGFKNLFKSVIDGLEKAGVMDEIAVGIGGYMALKLGSALAKILPSILTLKAITGASGGGMGGLLGGGAMASALSSMGGFSGLMTTDLGIIMGAGTALEIGLTFGTGILGGIVGAFAGGAVAKLIDKHIIAPFLKGFDSDLAPFYENFKWFGEGGAFETAIQYSEMLFEDFGSTIKATGDMMSGDTDRIKEGLSTLNTDTNLFFDLCLREIPFTKTLWEEYGESTIQSLNSSTESINSASEATISFSEVVSNSATRILEKFGAIADGIKEKMGNIKDALDQDLGLSDKWNNIKVSYQNYTSSKSRGKAKGYASGGIVDKGDLFLAGESGPEIVTSYNGDSAVMNMDQIIQTISASVAATSGGNITIPISLDGGLLDTIIVTAQQRQALRSGA